MILAFSEISWNCYCIGKVMDQIYRSRDHGWLLVHGGLATMERRDRSGAWEVIVIAWRERERKRGRSLAFSPMVPLGGGAAEMATRRLSTEAVGGAPMGRCF
jgi:hypothetical protein